MNEEKLEKAANQHLEQVGAEWSSYHSFYKGAEWLQNQPLVYKLTDEEMLSLQITMRMYVMTTIMTVKECLTGLLKRL